MFAAMTKTQIQIEVQLVRLILRLKQRNLLRFHKVLISCWVLSCIEYWSTLIHLSRWIISFRFHVMQTPNSKKTLLFAEEEVLFVKHDLCLEKLRFDSDTNGKIQKREAKCPIIRKVLFWCCRLRKFRAFQPYSQFLCQLFKMAK